MTIFLRLVFPQWQFSGFHHLLLYLHPQGKVKEEIERYSVIRTVTAVERADVVIVMIDASEGVTEQDAKIAGIAHERGKGVIIAVNKWDAIEKNDKTINKHTNRIREVLAYMPYAELVFISAKTGLRISRMFETIDAVIENQTLRIQTGGAGDIVGAAVDAVAAVEGAAVGHEHLEQADAAAIGGKAWQQPGA